MKKRKRQRVAKFKDGQVVLLIPDWEYVRVKETYIGRMRARDSAQACCIVEWPYGKTTSVYEKRLQRLSRRERDA